jgi:hypothetical protein
MDPVAEMGHSCDDVAALADTAAMADDLLTRVTLAQALPGEQAARALAGLWEELDENALVARLAVAHALADRQSRPSEELRWDLQALAIADRLTEAELEQAGAHFPILALYPSLHLNAGDAFRKIGDLDNARAHARRGRAALHALGEDPYGGMLTEGLARLEARIRQAHAREQLDRAS